MVDAVECAVALQRGLAERNAEFAEDQRIQVRIGINLGEVIVEGDDRYGEGVNIAARLEQLAEPGGIWVSAKVAREVEKKLAFGFEAMGAQKVKNIAEPVQAFRVKLDGLPAKRLVPIAARRAWQWAAVGLLIAGAVAFFYAPGIGRWGPMAPALAARPGIAVLPFLNMSDDKQQEFFVDGLTEDLIIDLSNLSGLFVISRNSAFTYKGQTVKPQQVAKELGVTHVLNGSVRRSADQVRITAQLVDAANDRQVWAGRFDRKLTDIFAVQDEVKQEIIAALAIQLTPGERASVQATAPTRNIEAYEYYLRGRYALNLLTRRALRLAYHSFEKALAIDPDFAEAYAGLAMTYATDLTGTSVGWNDWVRSPARARPQAEVLARKAQALSPKLASPELVLTRLALAEWRYDDAIAHARRAVEMESGNAEAHAMLALALTAGGQHQVASAEIDDALRRDPKPPPSTLLVDGIVRFGLQDYQRAASVFDQFFESMVDGGNWFGASFAVANDFYAGTHVVRAEASPVGQGPWGFGLAAVRFTRFYREDADMEHLLKGLHGANLPEFPSDLDPKKEQVEPVTGQALSALMMGSSFETLCTSPQLNGEFRFSENGIVTWTLRHDLTDTGMSRITEDQVCVTLPTVTRGREACYSVFKAIGNNHLTRDYAYAIAGPNLCYFKDRI